MSYSTAKIDINSNGDLVLIVKPLKLTDSQRKYRDAILKIKERPYEYFRISKELQSDPGIIAQALLGFKNIQPNASEKQMVDFIIISLNEKLEKCFTPAEEQKRK